MSRSEALEYEYDYGRCCPIVTYEGREREYIINLLASLSRHDRIWTMKQIIQKAPEFGVCRNLGANIFNYFVLFDLKDVDAIMLGLHIYITLAQRNDTSVIIHHLLLSSPIHHHSSFPPCHPSNYLTDKPDGRFQDYHLSITIIWISDI